MKENKIESKKDNKQDKCAYSYEAIKEDEEINLLIEKGNQVLGELGFTEHSTKHAAKVAQEAARILKELGYSAHEIELSKVAGYMQRLALIFRSKKKRKSSRWNWRWMTVCVQ